MIDVATILQTNTISSLLGFAIRLQIVLPKIVSLSTEGYDEDEDGSNDVVNGNVLPVVTSLSVANSLV